MVLSDKDLIAEIEARGLVFQPDLLPHRIQSASIDLTLHNVFHQSKLIHEPGRVETTIDVVATEREAYQYLEQFEADDVVLKPGQFLLGATAEAISIPEHLCGWIEGKSGRARLGLIVHCTAPHIAPGWGIAASTPHIVPPDEQRASGGTPQPKRITLEMVNLGSVNLRLRAGMGIAQLLIMSLSSPVQAIYSGVHHQLGT